MRNRRLYVESAPPHGRQVITKHGQHGAHPTRMINRGRRPDIQRPTGMEQVEAYCGVKFDNPPVQILAAASIAESVGYLTPHAKALCLPYRVPWERIPLP